MDVKMAIWMYMDVKNLKIDGDFFTQFWSDFTKIFQILTESRLTIRFCMIPFLNHFGINTFRKN